MGRVTACLACGLALLALLPAPLSAEGAGRAVFGMIDDFGMPVGSDCGLSYYYWPSPRWFYFYPPYELDIGERVGVWFQPGDLSMGGLAACDPIACQSLSAIRFVDFYGYGTYNCAPYDSPCMYELQFDVYCADESGSPVGPPLWSRSRIRSELGWNYLNFDPPISLCGCSPAPGSPPRVLVTAMVVIWSDMVFPFGHDGISQFPSECGTHDAGCLPMLYPRPYNSYYPVMHSGYYGHDFEYCPPLPIKDPMDETSDGSQYGYVELMWTAYFTCGGPSGARPTSWGAIKSLYD